MKVLFVHQNIPGQFRHIAPALAREAGNRVAFITCQTAKAKVDGVATLSYPKPQPATKGVHHYVQRLEEAVRYGQAAARAALRLKERGFVPDVIVVHPGWGEGLFLRDIFPESAIVSFCEFYFEGRGPDQTFEQDNPPSIDRVCKMRVFNAAMNTSLEASDWGIAPTWWQWSRHPEQYRHKISVIHDGIDTGACTNVAEPVFELPNGLTLTRDDEVVTYVSRNFEPYRGFQPFMESIETVLKRRPQARILLVGGDSISYSERATDAPNWRESALSRVNFDPSRVFITPPCSRDDLRVVMSLSRAHVYLSWPFVLSWSMLEAMSHECLMVGSRTPPVMEVIRDGDNGLLVDFFKPDQIADAVVRALENPEAMLPIRKRARQTVLDRYDLKTVCLPAQIDLISEAAERRFPAPTEDGWSHLPAAEGVPPRKW